MIYSKFTEAEKSSSARIKDGHHNHQVLFIDEFGRLVCKQVITPIFDEAIQQTVKNYSQHGLLEICVNGLVKDEAIRL
jgi:hypothetical protein